MTDENKFRGDRPDRQYTPPIGDYTDTPNGSAPSGVPLTYADINKLRRALVLAIKEIQEFQNVLEGHITKYSLKIDPDDRKLITSNNNEWPSNLGPAGDFITYRFYKALRFRNTTSAAYIRKRYEEGARDVTGTSALDMLILTDLMKDEAELIQGFLNEYIGDVTDVAEHRLLEQFQDWLISSVGYTRQLKALYSKGPTNPEFVLPGEIKRTTAQEAKQGQALFKVNLNSKNDAIERDVEFLQRNFSEYAGTFYSQFLGPAVRFRLNVSRTSLPFGGGINKTVHAYSNKADDKLGSALTDQMRRRVLFEEKMSNIIGSVKDRDRFRSYIDQLSIVGKKLPKAGPAVMVQHVPETEEMLEFFNEAEYQNSLPIINFAPSHKSLADLREDDHPQYVKKDGDTLTGDLALDAGVRIDGVRPSTHRHRGVDGSPQIHADDLIEGTLTDDSIDLTKIPTAPDSLSVTDFDIRIVPPGISVVDATIQWYGLDKHTYEINLVRLGDVPDVVE